VPGLLAGRKNNPTDGDLSPATVLAKKTTISLIPIVSI
jgi:hypothetical protein